MPLRPRKPDWALAPATRKAYAAFAGIQTLSPRIKLAARLYATGRAPTKVAAAEAAGLNPITFIAYTNHSPKVQAMLSDVDAEVAARVINIEDVIDNLSRKAIGKLGELMENGGSQLIQLKAAQDLADRGTRTSKIQRTVSAQLTINGEDAKSLAAALVKSKRVAEAYAPAMASDFDKVSGTNVLPDAPSSVG